MFTISDLKKHLGPGLGLRKNKYLIEIPIPGIEGRTLNILCQSAGLPERNITTQTIFKYGRKYTVRGETDYIGNYEVSILDDSNMNVRKVFDKWLKKVDDSKPQNMGILGGSYETGVGDVLDTIKSGVQLANTIKNAVENPSSSIDFFLGFIDTGNAVSAASYQTDINIEDGEENTLSQFSVSFAFSEFITLENRNPTSRLVDALIGDTSVDILNGIESLFE
jgi:hypothetical protein